MPFPYKKVLVIGATSGIGKALAARFIQEGSTVIVVGRRKQNLVDFVHEHGKDKASAVPFDITELDKIPNFVTKSASILLGKL
jgi:NADP-dependent 3-hydroxy acid dehydrogenase YdfG